MPTAGRIAQGHESNPWSASKTGSIRSDVKEQNGLEVPRQLQWAKWQAGGEFAKVVCVKNVTTDVVKFTYKLLPQSSPFSVDFPEPRRLSPGMSATIKVSFRPTTRRAYSDQLVLLAGAGATSIIVPLLAVLPASKLQVPPAVDFGCVPVHQTCMQHLPIKNVGDAALLYSWKVQAPFGVVPASGQLAAGQTLVCEVHFQPKEAAAYRMAAACSLDNGELLTVQVNGMAKFPFLSLESECVEFGSVLVGQTAEMLVRFGNHSPVPAHFSLAAGMGSEDGAFAVQPKQGTLLPNEYSMLRVTFIPRATGAFSCQTFSLAAQGGNRLSLTCQGTAVGPQLRLSQRVFAFGGVRSGQSPCKALYLENTSEMPLHFQFLVEPGGVFQLTRIKGVIPPRSLTHTRVKFAALAPGNYWQRLVCLVKDSAPQAIDVLASCHDDTSRPPPLSYKHIKAHLDRVAAGEELFLGPAQSDCSTATAAQESAEFLSIDGSGTCSSSSPLPGAASSADVAAEDEQFMLLRNRSGSGHGAEGDGTALGIRLQHHLQHLAGIDSWPLLFEGLEGPGGPAVTVTDTSLDFGCCSRLSPSEPQSFQVTNNTAAKLVVSLSVPGWQDPVVPTAANKPMQQVFMAFPESLELRPQATSTIRLAFRPPRDGQYYCQTLTLQASVKAMRSFRLVQDDQVVPPWTCAILATGNTFATLNPELSPKVSLSSTSINFPPCRLGEAVHQTLCLTNHGDTPVHFAFSAQGYSAAARANRSGGSESRLSQGGGGDQSSGSNRIAGSIMGGLVAGGAAWFGQFAVLPVQGVLEPKGQRLVALRFKPSSLNPSELQLSCTFNHSSLSSVTLLLSGTASEPRLVWDLPDNRLFFRPTCVGATSQRQITVRNASRVPVGWQWVLSKKLEEATEVEPRMGVLRGFEGVKVTVRFAPTKQCMYNARAALLLLPPASVLETIAPSNQAAETTLVSITPAALHYSQAAATAVAADLDAFDAGQHSSPRADSAAMGDDTAAASSNTALCTACEKLILTVVGEATEGALRLEPPSISFGSVHVGYPQHKSLALVNQSAGVLRYSVTVVDESPGGIDHSEAACEFGSAAEALAEAAAAARAATPPAAGADGCSTAGAAGDCWVDAPDGVVNARSSKAIMLTLLPRRRGQYRLRLNLHGSTLPPITRGHMLTGPGSLRSLSAGSPGSASAAAGSKHAGHASGVKSDSAASSPSPRNAEAAALRHCQSAGAAVVQSSHAGYDSKHAASGAAAGPEAMCVYSDKLAVDARAGSGGEDCCMPHDTGIAHEMSVAVLPDRPPLTAAAVMADASFPSLLLTDVFCEGLPKQVSWRLLGMSQLNAELHSAVSCAEVQAHEMSDKGQLSTDNAAMLLEPFLLDLGVAPAGGSSRSFWVQLSNNGVLPVEWELHSYDAPQVDLENWVEPAKPLTKAEKERAFIIDNKIFEVTPQDGLLRPGQSQQLCISFNPCVEGSYQLPLFFRIKDGKQVQLQLSGQAVPAATQLALTVHGSHSCLLVAAPIGELQPPLQCWTLRNGGPAPLQYRLDTSPLQQLASQNYSAAVIKYAGGSPLAGEIPPGQAAVFNWLFQPLEAKVYSVALPLSLGDAAPQPLLIRGRGYHPGQHPEHAAPSEEEAARYWQGWLGFSPHPGSTATESAAGSGTARSRSSRGSSRGGRMSSAMGGPSGRYLLSSPEVLDLGVCLPANTIKQLVTLSNTAPVPLAFSWCLGVFEGDRGIISGRLAIIPATGVLEPGEARVCQVSFESGLQPQLFSGEVFCRAVPAAFNAESPTAAAGTAAGVVPGFVPASSGLGSQGLTLEQWQLLCSEGQEGDAADVADEEIIAQHPPRQSLPVPGQKLRQRLPLHLSMTQAACNKFDPLKQQYQQTLTLQHTAAGQWREQQQRLGGLVTPQLLTVTMQGAVLCKTHINAGSYIRPQELPRTHRFLEVAHLLPTVKQPVSLLPAPGSMGISAAAARAAHAPGKGHHPSAVAVAAAGGSQALAMAGAVLQQVLTDAWSEADVVAAFDGLEPGPVQPFVQVQQQQRRQRQQQQQQQPPGQPLQQEQNMITDAAEAEVEAAADSSGDEVTACGQVLEAAVMSGGKGSVVAVLQEPEFHAFADYVVDSALLGILQEGGLVGTQRKASA